MAPHLSWSLRHHIYTYPPCYRGCNSTKCSGNMTFFCNVSPDHSIWGPAIAILYGISKIRKSNFFRLGPEMICTKFGDDCSKFVGGVAKTKWRKINLAVNGCGQYPISSGWIAPHWTLCFCGSSAIHLPNVKLIGWTVVEIIEGQTDRKTERHTEIPCIYSL